MLLMINPSVAAAMKPLVLGFSTDDTLSGEGNTDDANDEDKGSRTIVPPHSTVTDIFYV
jgi:hypothetical protein